MTDRLDTMGREAAADLRERVRDVDTEAVLERLDLGDAGQVRSPERAGRWRRPVLAVAAVFLLVAAVAGVGRLLRDGSDGEDAASEPTEAINAHRIAARRLRPRRRGASRPVAVGRTGRAHRRLADGSSHRCRPGGG